MRALRKNRSPDTTEEPDRELSYGIAQQVFDLRNAQGMTQSQLAEAVGTKQPAISGVESASKLPTLGLLVRIARALGARLVVRFEKPGDPE